MNEFEEFFEQLQTAMLQYADGTAFEIDEVNPPTDIKGSYTTTNGEEIMFHLVAREG